MKSKRIGDFRHCGALPALALAMGIFVCLAGCGDPARTPDSDAKPLFATTIPPLQMILAPLAGDDAQVVSLTSGAFSPHTHELKPGDLRTLSRARALFRVGGGFDRWADGMRDVSTVEVFDLLPQSARRDYPEAGAGAAEPAAAHDPDHDHADDHGHEAGEPDPHFWTDPLTVKALIGPLTESLVALDPASEAGYRARAAALETDLDALAADAGRILTPLRGQAVVLFHPSLHYLLARHGIEVAAVIEPAPGREPTVMEMQRLARVCRERDVRALFTEPQLAPDAAKALAEMLKLPTIELDPLGGGEGRQTYGELILFNARALAQAMSDGGNRSGE